MVYYQICMACHGDRGQGLTEEWRLVWEDDFNCWKSKCHASNHPPQGFQLPRVCPPVLGTGSLAAYADADALHTKIADTMPWWKPKSLTSEQGWELTAYLLRARGELPAGLVLDAGTAPIVRLHSQPMSRGKEQAGAAMLLVALGVAAVALMHGNGKRP